MTSLSKLSVKLFTLSLLAAAFGFTTLRAQTVAYVANNLNGTVEAINTSTDAVIATIGGFSHPSDLALSPNGALLYVRNSNNQISVVNTATNTVTTNISFPLGAPSEGAGPTIVFSPNGQFAYFANSIGNLTVINTQTSTVTQTVPLPSNFIPTAVAVSPDGNTIYVASGNADGIQVINANTFATVTTIASGHLILDLALSPNGSTLYGSDSSGLIGGSSGVLVVNTATNAVVTTVPLPFSSSSPSFVTGLAVTPDGLNVYAENFLFVAGNSTVNVISTASDSITTTIPASGLNLTALAITPDGSTVLATNAILSATVDSTVAVIPTATNTIANSITVGLFADTLCVGNLNAPFAAFNVAPPFITPYSVALAGDFKLGANSSGLNPARQSLTLTVGTLSVTIPAGSFQQVGTLPDYVFHGVINGLGVSFNLLAIPGTSNSYVFGALITGVDLLGSPEPVTVTLEIGENTGAASVFYF